jgi:Leucine-rich repeat (LRR) protein
MTAKNAMRHFQSLDAFVADEHKLHISGLRFSDLDARYLTALPNLKQLVLSGTSFTDESLPVVTNLIQLELLDLSMTTVTDAIVATLPHLNALRTLGLYETRITDSTLASIAELPNLQMLNISANRQITDVGFRKLATMKHLATVEIHGTSVSREAVSDFSRKNPRILIVTDDGVIYGKT